MLSPVLTENHAFFLNYKTTLMVKLFLGVASRKIWCQNAADDVLVHESSFKYCKNKIPKEFSKALLINKACTVAMTT